MTSALRALVLTLVVAATAHAARLDAVTTADVNHDGSPDLIVRGARDESFGTRIGVMLNDGHGNFGAPVVTTVDDEGFSAVGDVNGDGTPDVIIESAVSATAITLRGNPDGTFQAPLHTAYGDFSPPFVADFDRDGKADLLFFSSQQSSLQHGNGDGTFAPPVTIPQGADVGTVADVNGDGAPDLITYTFQVTVVTLNDGHGQFNEHFPIVDDYTLFATAGDFNGDGRVDLLLFEFGYAKVRLGNGDGTFSAPRLTRLVPEPPVTFDNRRTSTIAADFDGDGRLDFMNHGEVYLGNGDGTFRSRLELSDAFVTSPQATDVDGNGSADLVFVEDDAVRVVRTRVDAPPSVHTTMTLTTDKSRLQYGELVTLTAKVSGAAAPADGVVRFSANGQPLALVEPDADGVAVLVTGLARGALTITATYTGNPVAIESAASLNVDVSKVVTVVQLGALRNPVFYPQHTLVYPAIRGGTGFEPTGNIVVREGSTVLGSVPANGQFLDLPLPPGMHTLIATYEGDANYDPGSATLVVNVIVATTQKRSVRH